MADTSTASKSLTTPPNQHATLPNVQLVTSTPFGEYSGSNTAHRIRTHHSDYEPYIRMDLKQMEEIDFAVFMRAIFGIDSDTMVTQLQRIPKKFADALSQYVKPVGHEKERYEPFIDLVNAAIVSAKSHMVVNDPLIVRGSPAERKPDIVTTSPVAQESNGDVKERLHWAQINTFLEFKVRDKSCAAQIPTLESNCESPFVARSTKFLPMLVPSRF